LTKSRNSNQTARFLEPYGADFRIYEGHNTVGCDTDELSSIYQKGLLYVKKNNNYGFIDKFGREVIPLV
jgi:hypothetical protein